MRFFILFIHITTLFFFSCSIKKEDKREKLNIVTTTGMLRDAAIKITGDKADITALMGPGVDPHLYKATQGDIERLNKADIIIINGLHLEGKMSEVLEKLQKKKMVIIASDGIPENLLRSPANFKGSHDPHIWFNVNLWKLAVQQITKKIKEKDSVNAVFYSDNSAKFLAQLDSLNGWVKIEIATVPKNQRVLITAHDAFEYFGAAYDIEVMGLQGISTVSDFGLNDIKRLVDTISVRKVKAVFVESSVPQKNIQAVVEGCKSRGHEVIIGGTLFSDAMGAEGTPEGTYIGMVRANVNTIVKALK